MDSRMITISRTYDPDLVFDVMTHPALWPTVAEEGQDPMDFQPEMNGEVWLVVTHGTQVAGLYNLHAHNSVTLEIHAQILPEFRGENAKESSIALLEWFVANAPSQFQKLIAQVPTVYPNVVAFTKNAGFQEEGLNRQSCRENGELCDQVMLGITRQEIESFLRAKQ